MKPIPLIFCVILGVTIGLVLYTWLFDYAVQMTIIGLLVSTLLVGGFAVYLVGIEAE